MAAPARVADSLESDLRAEAARLFGIEADAVLDALDKLSKRDPTDPFVKAAFRRILSAYAPDGGRFHALWLERYGELIGRAVEVGGRGLAAEVGFDFTIRSPRVVRAIEDRTERLAAHVTRGTAERIGAAVKSGYRDGVGVREIAKRIRDTAFDAPVTTARATLIARIETIGSMNEGEWQSATLSGVFVEKGWLHSGNRRDPREEHLSMDGERRPINRPFSNGLMRPHAPGAPIEQIANCGCSLEFFS